LHRRRPPNENSSGKLIYEGDILEYEWLTDSFAPHIWKRDTLVIEDIRENYTQLNNILNNKKRRNVKIIGNIHEHGHLLTQEEKSE
jgi:hypothetical protein